MWFSPFCQIWWVPLPFPQIKALTIRSLVLQHIQITIIVTIQCVLVCVDKILLFAVLFNGFMAPMVSLLLHSSGSEWLRVNKYPSSYRLGGCGWGSVDLNLIHILWCTFSVKIERSISIIEVLFVLNGNDFEAKIFYPIPWGFNATQYKRNAVLSIVLSPSCMKLNNLKSPWKKMDETEVENEIILALIDHLNQLYQRKTGISSQWKYDPFSQVNRWEISRTLVFEWLFTSQWNRLHDSFALY